LNERADGLAAELRKLGVGPDVCVGVCLQRSAEMVASKLAVWKAGGAYVPLDPSYPAERLKFMLEDAKMPVLLTQSSLRGNLKFEISNLKVLCVDELLNSRTKDDRVSRLTPHAAQFSTPNSLPSTSLAYVIYTSGSTGQPKGVEIEHRSLVNLIAWHQRAYRVTPADRATQIATPAFDASVWELWPYLTCGASIHIPDEETRLSPGKLLDWLAAEQITLTFIPTPIAEATLDKPWPADCRVRALLTGGDKLHRAPGNNLPCALSNHYGPTENTVVTTWTLVPPIGRNAHPPPIGRPIANTQVFVLDKNLQPVPVGVPGELHIGGAGLARGYHHRPDLTAEKFIPNPFVAGTQAPAWPAADTGKLKLERQPRLYKTGDLVRWLPDGQIEFLGRTDNQVKIRGQRIELGEIETALGQHPDVREAVVVPREDAKGETRLVACIVPKAENRKRKVESGDLRRYLHGKLPEAMVPAAFVFLDALPLTPNGKVDGQALPAPDFQIESAKPFVTPRTPTEKKLAEIWREVLGVERIGADDNFFELGGHSLTATQVIARMHGAFRVEIPLRDLFDLPTVAGLAGTIDAAGHRTEALALPPLARVARGGELPLSFAQERLWFLEQLEPGLAFNNIPIALRLEGALDIGALKRALNEIVRRHETFRTIFKNQNGDPAAVVETVETFAVPVVDLSAAPEHKRDSEARRLMTEEARKVFDLTKSPLLRAKLLKLEVGGHLLLLTTHHIACDGWSLGVIYRELAALYEAFSHGAGESPQRAGPAPGAPVPVTPQIDYADFAAWQREWLQDGVLEKQLAFWKQQLAGAKTTLDLPTDHPRPPVQSYRGAAKHFLFPPRLVSALNTLARREEATLFMLLLAALQTLLHRLTGQEDILIGSPVAGRQRVELETLIGIFLNMIVLRGDLSGDPTFRELLQRVRQTALAAYAHQDVPFEKLVEAIQPARDLGRSPVFQVMFVLQNEPLRPLELAGLKLTPVPVHSGTAKFDLLFSLEENGDGLSGFIEYNTDLFDAETIERWIGHYQMLLEAVAAEPEQRLSQLPLLTEPERKRIFTDWNNTHADFPRDKCIHELFEEMVERTPDAVALVFEDEELTYCELNEQADRLASRLQILGVGPDVCAGICVKRSLEMVVGLLGILKAGGGYVPLDPAYPEERLAFMLEDSRAPVLLTQTSLHGQFKSEISNLKLLCVDELLNSRTQDENENDRVSRLTPRDARLSTLNAQPSTGLAYVIYISGSTGQPKGVMVTHRNVVNFFTGMDRVLGTKPGVWLAVTGISFDISALELLWTLARGFKVIIQPDGDRDDSVPANGQWRSLPEQILRHGVTHLQCTPSLAGTLVLAPESRMAMRSLDKLLLGGEVLPVSLANQLREILRGDLFNMYGPTETTIWSAVHRVEQIENSVPIGRPVANTQIYILDKNLQPVPAGVPGEIFIGGEGVARGYLNRPELTAEKFIRHPFGADGHSRLYRTGDLGRWRADGTVEFLGRADHQVKIRGHRVELGEIEATLGAHPAVRECVVAAREDSPGDKRLVAYAVAAPDAKPSTTELRRFAREKLPEAMVPSAFVLLGRLPLTPNGKVNRRALPAPGASRPELETLYLAPRSDAQRAIARIWRDVLRIEKVGLHDNFFELGGHSLLMTQVIIRVREAFQIELPMRRCFESPTVAGLAGALEELLIEEIDQLSDDEASRLAHNAG
jgi:amino acid adenylation domain-containing protein